MFWQKEYDFLFRYESYYNHVMEFMNVYKFRKREKNIISKLILCYRFIALYVEITYFILKKFFPFYYSNIIFVTVVAPNPKVRDLNVCFGFVLLCFVLLCFVLFLLFSNTLFKDTICENKIKYNKQNDSSGLEM